MRVMIVEDEALIRFELMQRITRLGHSIVASSASGEEAVQLADRERPDLILMDVQLQGAIDGIEALRRIGRFHSCRMTVLSAYNQSQLEAAGELPQNTLVFSKPIADHTLLSIFTIDP